MIHVLPKQENHIHDLFTVCPCGTKIIILEEQIYVEHTPYMEGMKTFRQLVQEGATNLEKLWVRVTLN